MCKTSKTSESLVSFSVLLIQIDILYTILLTISRTRIEKNINITLPEKYKDVASY